MELKQSLSVVFLKIDRKQIERINKKKDFRNYNEYPFQSDWISAMYMINMFSQEYKNNVKHQKLIKNKDEW